MIWLDISVAVSESRRSAAFLRQGLLFLIALLFVLFAPWSRHLATGVMFLTVWQLAVFFFGFLEV